MTFPRNCNSRIVPLLCIYCILWITIQKVNVYWMDSDIHLTVVTCGVAVVAVFMLILRRSEIQVSGVDTLVTFWFLYAMIRACCDTTYPCGNFCLRAVQMFSLYLAVRLLFSSSIPAEWILVSGILLCAGYEVILGACQILSGTGRHHLYALSGTFLNPGPYSAFLSMALVMSCQMRKKQLIILFAILLPATWSRAAWLSSAICLGIIYWDKWKQWKWLVLAAGLLLAAGLYFLKKGSADGRLVIYIISLFSICRHPLFGSGISSFCHRYAEGMSAFSASHPDFDFRNADVTSSAFNSLLQIGVEQGLVGVCLAVALITILLLRLHRTGKVLCMGLLCLVLFSMFSYPFDLLPYQIIFVLIAAFAGTGHQIVKWSNSKIVKSSILASALLLSSFTYRHIKERAQAEADYRMMAGVNHADFIRDYYEILPLMRANEHFLFDFGRILATAGRYNDSNSMLRMGTLVSNDPMFYVMQGNNCRDMGFYPEAEHAYRKAFHVMPNRLYPLYQLMLLYERQGDTERMADMARQVIAFKEKVVSPATEEMKAKARERSLSPALPDPPLKGRVSKEGGAERHL